MALGAAFDGARAILTQVQTGEYERALARLRADQATGRAQADSDAARFIANTQRAAADLQLAAAQARAIGASTEASQFEAALAAIGAAQREAIERQNAAVAAVLAQRESQRSGVPAVALFGAVGAALVLGWYAVRRHSA